MTFFDWYWLSTAFVFGAVVGSFLNVVIYRLHTGKSLGGHSHCLSCEKPLRWFELLPLVSYLSVRGRCRGCGSYIPSRYFWVELLTAGTFMFLFWQFSAWPILLVFYTIMAAILIVLIVYDVRHTIIPDELSGLLLGLVVGLLLYDGWGQWNEIALYMLGGLLAGGFFWLLWIVSKGRWIGLGDAKLAVPLGMMVGIEQIFSFVVLGFWVGAVVSVSIIIFQKLLSGGKRYLRFYPLPLTMKSEVPFAPFLILGFVLVQFFNIDVFSLTNALVFSF